MRRSAGGPPRENKTHSSSCGVSFTPSSATAMPLAFPAVRFSNPPPPPARSRTGRPCVSFVAAALPAAESTRSAHGSVTRRSNLVRLLEDTPRGASWRSGAHQKRHRIAVLAALLLVACATSSRGPSVFAPRGPRRQSRTSPIDHLRLTMPVSGRSISSRRRRRATSARAIGRSGGRRSAVPSASRAYASAHHRAGPMGRVAATDAATAGLCARRRHRKFRSVVPPRRARFRDPGTRHLCREQLAHGWQHAEPVLRSLTYAMLDHEGGNPPSATPRLTAPDATTRKTQNAPREWLRGKPDADARTSCCVR